MKSLSLTTFILFIFCLCLRGYSYYTYSKLRSKVTNNKSILSNDKKQSLALLNTLNDLNDLKSERKIASVKSDNQVKSALEITFINDFYEPKNNLEELQSLQKKIRESNLKEKMSDNSLESFPIRFIYFLVIRENFDLSELKRSEAAVLYNFDREQVKQMKIESNKHSFLTEILNFKNVNTDELQEDIEYQNSLARLEEVNKTLAAKNETNPEDEEKADFIDQLPEEVLEQLAIAETSDIDIEEKLKEMDYTEQEVAEIIEGYEY
ncbi:hypothetical protein [Halobacteriovorax sp. HLS]|uniref:hypothetical protein n=1 Tax=Halobacteriovorax sp. HLS TaxID=2234000 RepID=UPI000FD88514|nr:hypothetical protein [Halobacteriovorax sp. HLS]